MSQDSLGFPRVRYGLVGFARISQGLTRRNKVAQGLTRSHMVSQGLTKSHVVGGSSFSITLPSPIWWDPSPIWWDPVQTVCGRRNSIIGGRVWAESGVAGSHECTTERHGKIYLARVVWLAWPAG